MELYRYGLLAWFWRVLMLLGVGFGAVFLWMGLNFGEIWLVPFGLGFGAFPLVLGQMVATSIRQLPDGRLRVHTLNLTWRTIAPERLGKAHYRSYAYSDGGGVHAPRAWVEVRGGPFIYLDLLAHIPDPTSFQALFKITPAGAPRMRGRRAPRNDWDPPTF